MIAVLINVSNLHKAANMLINFIACMMIITRKAIQSIPHPALIDIRNCVQCKNTRKLINQQPGKKSESIWL